jgi:hypothetical protein
VIGYCKYCQVDIYDDFQSCDCFPCAPEVVKAKKLIREQGASGEWTTELSVDDYNAEIARIEDVPEGGWHAIKARMKLDRKRPIEGADPVDEVSISINDDEYKARMK